MSLLNAFKRLLGGSESQKSDQGEIKFFNRKKGFGMIICPGLEKDVFVHITHLNEQRVNKGDKVAFRLVKSAKGYEAHDVKLLKSA